MQLKLFLLLLQLSLISSEAISSATVGRNVRSNLIYQPFCPTAITFDSLYNRFELRVPISIGAAAESLQLTDLTAKADAVLSGSGSQIRVAAYVTDAGTAELSLFCNTFQRCKELRNELISNPSVLNRGITFTAAVEAGSRSVKVAAVRAAVHSASLIPPSCNKGWIVFQRRVDSSLSFYQNWRTYARGFGNKESNYWMGLDNLNAQVATGLSLSSCWLKVEVETVTGHKFSGVWKQFQVENERQKYRIIVGKPSSANSLKSSLVTYMSGARFSTYDRDHDSHRIDCSRKYGFGGWWFKACHGVFLNGVYPDKPYRKNPSYASVATNGHVPVKSSVMSFKCADAPAANNQ